MNSILLFAGTTEGRQIAEALGDQPVSVTVSVATEYGETLIAPKENVRVLHGRKNAAEIEALIRETQAQLLIDATHPYAVEVTRTLKAVCASTGTEYMRVLRGAVDADGCVFVDDADAAVRYLNDTEGNVLLTVGSKELARYTAVRDFETRLYARILPVKESADAAFSLGFSGKNLICMQGPFSEEMNAATIRAIGARYLVTKDTGSAGGFAEKIAAAKACGVTPIVIRRPVEEQGADVKTCLMQLQTRFGLCAPKKRVTVIGIGTDGERTLTEEAVCAVRQAELLVGAKRVTDALGRFCKPVVHAIAPQEIEAVLRGTDATRIVVAMSGDTGFFSGTKKLLPRIADLEPTVLPGISSVSYLAAKLGVPYHDAALLSAHGRAINLPQKVRKNALAFVLVGGENGVRDQLTLLCNHGLGTLSVAVGTDLGSETEAIARGTAEELKDKTFSPLAVICIENPDAAHAIVTHGRPDGDFLRTEVPMTKSEVRAVTLSKLMLTKNAVCWDVGAGTGSVSLETAECCEDGQVYAIERNEAACDLIEQNKRHLGVMNVTVVRGSAPEALSDLPAPTHVFIGGSGGNLKAIIEVALSKNPRVRIVLNTVTAETFAEATAAIRDLHLFHEEIVELNVSRGRKVGGYHLMTAQNPVYIISCEGGGEDA
ncbi:MAG: precorrin-6A reductase [Clostridia bacterium]|nr:precorrin-6A reductase [Clostridia bacterium]